MVAPTGAPDELPIDVDLIKVLASDSRRDILRILGERRRTLTELAEDLGLKKATVLEHLQKLVEADLIRRLDEDERLWIYYELTPRGKRLVRPERTRFLLILGGTAAAALVLGVVLTVGLMQNAGEDAADAGIDARKSFANELVVEAPPVAWRGLDEGVTVRVPGAPPDASLLLAGAGGTQTRLALADGNATLDAAALDALAPGAYEWRLASDVGEVGLGGALDVRDPDIAAFPLALPSAGGVVDVVVVPPGQPAPSRIVANGATFADGEPVRASVGPDGRLAVGRLHLQQLAVLPDVEIGVARVDAQLAVDARNASGALPGAQVALDGEIAGTTGADGRLVLPWPASGEHALRVSAPTGAAREIAFVAFEEELTVSPARLRIDAYDAQPPGAPGMRVRADVHNDGRVAQLVTVSARQAGILLASALVEVPAGGRAEALLVSPLASPDVVDVTAHSATSRGALLLGEGYATAASPAPAAAPAEADAASGSSARAFYSFDSAPPADARTSLRFARAVASATPATEAGGEAMQVPGVAPALVVALLAVAALAARRRRA